MIIAASAMLMACQPEASKPLTENAEPNSVAADVSDAPSDARDASRRVAPDSKASGDNAVIKTHAVTILALGDSLTEGLGVPEQQAYPAQLQAALHDMGYTGVTVINSGLSGETSTGLTNRLAWALQTNPDITILTIGANDAMRGVDTQTVEANVRTAIKTLQDNGSAVVLGGMQIYDNLGEGYVNDFASIYPKIAQDMNVAYIPFFLQGVAGNASLNQGDAIHPTAEGYAVVVADNILPVLTPVLQQTLKSTDAIATQPQ